MPAQQHGHRTTKGVQMEIEDVRVGTQVRVTEVRQDQLVKVDDRGMVTQAAGPDGQFVARFSRKGEHTLDVGQVERSS